jgi:hypothetical protein
MDARVLKALRALRMAGSFITRVNYGLMREMAVSALVGAVKKVEECEGVSLPVLTTG